MSARKWRSVTVAVLTVATTWLVAVATTGVAAAGGVSAPVTFGLSAPTGAYPVGTTSVDLVDPARQDPWKPERVRELVVSLWYPAGDADQYPRAPWMTSALAAAFDTSVEVQRTGIRPGTVNWTPPTAGHRNAPLARAGGPYPVVVYSPGLGVPRAMATTAAQEAASQGFVVITVDHPGEAAPVEFPDGHVDPGQDLSKPETMEAIGRYALTTRVADLRFVLDQLAIVNAGGNPDAEHRPLPPAIAGALNMAAVGAVGHSFGAMTVTEAMRQDERIQAGANLDGVIAPNAAAEGLGQRPVLLMGAGQFVDYTGTTYVHNHSQGCPDWSWPDFWAHHAGWKRDFTLAEGGHMSFTDDQVILPQIAQTAGLSPTALRSLIGTVDPGRAVTAQNAYLTAFLQQSLRGTPSPLLDGPSVEYPDMVFVP